MIPGVVRATVAPPDRDREGRTVAMVDPLSDERRARRLSVVPDEDDGDERVHERQVAQGLLAGDADALEAAFRRWGGLVHGFCRRAVGADAADDLTQQVFVEAWRTRDRFDPERGVVPGWLIGIARNLVARHGRQAARVPTPVADAQATEPPIPDVTPDILADQLTVAAALDVLSEPQRATLRLSFFHDLTQAEVAEQLGLPLGTVKSHHRRGLARLRDHLESSHVAR